MLLLEALRKRARRLRAEALALALAARHSGTPWYAKAFAAMVVAYALSPIDLVPDFIPVLGQLDDLILVPLGLALAVNMIPPAVLAECRERARHSLAEGGNGGRVAAAVIVGLWLGLAALGALWAIEAFGQTGVP